MSSVLTRTTTVVYLFLVLGSVFGYHLQKPKNNAQSNRRNFLAFVTGSVTASALVTENPANAIISSKYCAYGSGEGCEDLAEGNEFIQQLQARSAANKEKNESVGAQRRKSSDETCWTTYHNDLPLKIPRRAKLNSFCWIFFRSVLSHRSSVLYSQDALYSFYMKNYPDVFAVSGKTMVKKPDGSFMLLNGEELMALKKENKIGVENMKAMGGKVSDMTQKPVLVLKEWTRSTRNSDAFVQRIQYTQQEGCLESISILRENCEILWDRRCVFISSTWSVQEKILCLLVCLCWNLQLRESVSRGAFPLLNLQAIAPQMIPKPNHQLSDIAMP